MDTNGWIGVIALAIGIIGLAIAIKQGNKQIKAIKEEIKPLLYSLTQSNKAQLHEKMAMMHKYYAKNFQDEPLLINPLIADIKAALVVKHVASQEQCSEWVIQLGLLIEKLNDEIPSNKKEIETIKHYKEKWACSIN